MKKTVAKKPKRETFSIRLNPELRKKAVELGLDINTIIELELERAVKRALNE